MSDYNQLVREHARLALLRFLEGAPKYTSNVSMMTQLLHRVGISFTRDQTMTEIAWLYEQGLVETEERVGFVIATATVRGIEVAQGIATHPGVQRRRPGTYKNPAGARIADMVMPRQPVPAEKFKWTEYPLAEAFNTPDAQVGRTGRVKQLEFGGTEKTDSVDDYGLETPIPYSDIQAAATARANGLSKYDPERHSVNMLMETIENIREARVAGIVHNPDTYAAARRIALTGTDRFDDYANSDPIQVIKDAILGTLIYRPNTLVLGMEVWSFLSSHPKIVNAIKGNLTDEGIVTREQFVALFSGEGITQLLVGDAWTNSAKPGQDPVLSRAWGKHISLLHINPMAAVEGGGITFGMTAALGGRIAGRIEDKDVGLQGGVRVRTGERLKELIIAKDVGYFIQNAIS